MYVFCIFAFFSCPTFASNSSSNWTSSGPAAIPIPSKEGLITPANHLTSMPSVTPIAKIPTKKPTRPESNAFPASSGKSINFPEFLLSSYKFLFHLISPVPQSSSFDCSIDRTQCARF